ncbi:MAG: N-acetylmuramoyl-L-alanine amidase [Syntrophomonas sp.]|nr:N-acetylmuramoyl-L-alanine amidase [Syntrophomonas sp.]
MIKSNLYKIIGLALILILSITSKVLINAGNSKPDNYFLVTPKITWMNSPLDTINSITQKHKFRKKIIVIDPGHGGDDPGAIYPHTKDENLVEVREKDLNLDISLRLYDMLKESGLAVEMTRFKDISLKNEERSEFANHLNAVLMVSIHNNSYTINSCNGTSTYYNPSINNQLYGIAGKKAAELIQRELVNEIGTNDIGIKEITPQMNYTNTNMPIVLAEIAYISNDTDRKYLCTEAFRIRAAQGLYKGIMAILEEMTASNVPASNQYR